MRTAGLYGLHGSASKGGNFVQRMIARAREQGSLNVVADQRLQPTFTADLAAARSSTRSNAGATGVAAPHRVGRLLVARVHDARSCSEAGIDVPIQASTTVIPPGGVDRPLNGVLARPRADALGPAAAAALAGGAADYMDRAGLRPAAGLHHSKRPKGNAMERLPTTGWTGRS